VLQCNSIACTSIPYSSLFFCYDDIISIWSGLFSTNAWSLSSLVLVVYICPCTGWPKSRFTDKKLNISLTARANQLIFLSAIEACPRFISIKKYLERPFIKYRYWLQEQNFTFSQIGKNQYTGWSKSQLTEGKIEYFC
jgi:hypothetical protein